MRGKKMRAKKTKKILFFAVLGFTLSLSAKEIPRNEYIKYLPITYPKIMSHTEANRLFSLYGDKSDPAYQDVDPLDGIDDRRFRILRNLAVRFAPYLVQNTSDAPMDFKYYAKNPHGLPLNEDTWDLSQETPRLVQSNSVDFFSGDSQLLSLLEEFRPDRSANDFLSKTKRTPGAEYFKVLYFDFPGQDEKSWGKKYETEVLKRQNKQTSCFVKTYVHMFISDERARLSDTSGYEFVIQYWFFYPHNDGGNNHEGDWEHINVVISPIDRVEDFLAANDIYQILEGEGSLGKGSEEQLVIKRLEYYFHYRVMILDFSRPNVYKPKNKWNQDIRTLEKNRNGKSWIWEKIRYLAFKDAEEREINTHPFGYIGGDCRGYEQILSTPGGTNRDSHGNYPFSGIYREVGPANSSEKIKANIDHRDYYKNAASQKTQWFGRGNVIPLDDPHKIAIIPDWEQVIELVLTNKEARKNWSWLVLPVRFGYPASSSPFAGLIEHANTGNLSSLGPAYNEGWNRVGGTSGYDVYDPHKLSKAFPLDWQSNFSNGLGFFNLVIPTLQNLPPFNLLTRTLSMSVNGLNSRKPVFSPKETLPFRYVGISFGMFQQKIPGFLTTLAFSPDQINEIQFHIENTDPGSQIRPRNRRYVTETTKGMMFQLNFHLGMRLISENTLRYSSAATCENIDMKNRAEPFKIRTTLDLWEYTGSFRYNLGAGKVQPYVKAGYGWTWFRAKNISAEGQILAQSKSEWIRKPSLSKFENLLPNSWHYGFGIEVLPIRTRNGLDIGLKLEYLKNHSSFGIDMLLSPWSDTTKGKVKVSPGNLALSLTFSY
jgi:opacity protein-like surface antigen